MSSPKMKEEITYKFVRDFPRKCWSIPSKIYRPFAVFFTYVALKLRLSPNSISLIMAIICLIAGVLMFSKDFYLIILGTILFIYADILDYVDGGIARYLNQQTKYGDFIDVLGAYFLHALLPICLGIGLSFNPENSLLPVLNMFSIGSRLLPELLLIFGAFASLANILLRLIAMRVQITFDTNPRDEENLPGNRSQVFLLISYIDSTISPRGLYFPFLIMATVFSILEWFIFTYFIIYLLALFVYTGWYTFSLRRK